MRSYNIEFFFQSIVARQSIYPYRKLQKFRSDKNFKKKFQSQKRSHSMRLSNLEIPQRKKYPNNSNLLISTAQSDQSENLYKHLLY